MEELQSHLGKCGNRKAESSPGGWHGSNRVNYSWRKGVARMRESYCPAPKHQGGAFPKQQVYTLRGAFLCAQSCPTLSNPMDHSLPGSSVHGILQARILEWVAMPSSRGSFQHRDRTHVSSVSYTSRWVLYH